jgi:hypothetical protein
MSAQNVQGLLNSAKRTIVVEGETIVVRALSASEMLSLGPKFEALSAKFSDTFFLIDREADPSQIAISALNFIAENSGLLGQILGYGLDRIDLAEELAKLPAPTLIMLVGTILQLSLPSIIQTLPNQPLNRKNRRAQAANCNSVH